MPRVTRCYGLTRKIIPALSTSPSEASTAYAAAATLRLARRPSADRVAPRTVDEDDEKSISLTGSPMVGFHKRIQGSLAGGSNPIFERPNLLGLYKSGHLKLDEIITRRYTLEQVNQGYHDLLAGKTSAAGSSAKANPPRRRPARRPHPAAA
jgi:hypothetical protein